MIGTTTKYYLPIHVCKYLVSTIFFHYRLLVNTFLVSVFAYKQQMQVMSFSLIGFSVGNTTLESFFPCKKLYVLVTQSRTKC